MKSIVHLLFLLGLASIGLVACSEPTEYIHSQDTVYVTDTTRIYRDIEGQVLVLDACDTASDQSGVKVYLHGLKRVTVTDSAGRFRFAQVPAMGSMMLSFYRDDIYSFTAKVSQYEPRATLYRHHDYGALIQGEIKRYLIRTIGTKEILAVDSNGILRATKVKDTVFTTHIVVPITPIDEDGYPNKSTEGYLLLSRTPNIDPLDSTTYLKIIAEGEPDKKARNIEFTDKQAAEWGLVSGERIYGAASSRSTCLGQYVGPRYSIPGRRISRSYEIIVP